MEEASLPPTTVRKFIKKASPGFNFAQDVVELVTQCGNEFIAMVTSETVQVAEKKKKKMLTPVLLVEALKELEMEDMVAQVQASVTEVEAKGKKERERKNNKKRKWKESSLSPEELIAKQQQLFAKARKRAAVSAATGPKP